MDLFYNFQKINLLVGFFAVQIDKVELYHTFYTNSFKSSDTYYFSGALSKYFL